MSWNSDSTFNGRSLFRPSERPPLAGSPLSMQLVGKVKPWWEPIQVPQGSDALVLHWHLAGWRDGVWCDGPTILWHQRRAILMMPPNVGYRLQLDLRSLLTPPNHPESDGVSTYQITSIEDFSPYRRSWQKALEHCVGGKPVAAEAGLVWQPETFGRREVVLAVMLRAAFPDSVIVLEQLPADQILKPLWRRLGQNLGLVFGKIPRPPRNQWHSVATRDVMGLVPESMVVPLMHWWNRRGAVIPPKLISWE